ncbi:MAG TPA: hypothetical protein VN224_05945 [Xanthomonadales bacterium]|nr:hypothetical protein [Xanthomonadales bacterium]
MAGAARLNQSALERLLGAAQPYAIARVTGLTAALGWICGCRAIEHDPGAYTLITCENHLDLSERSARMMTFR